MNISNSFRVRFVIMRATFYKNFGALRLNLDKQRAREKKPFPMVFIFFSTNRLILIFHILFCRYFEYLHFLYRTLFPYNQYFSFYKRKMCFLQLFDFFAHIFIISLKHISFLMAFRRFSWKEMLVYNFFPVKFYFYWTILATQVYEKYNAHEKS